MSADKLFQPFQRPHMASESPGTGVGLASVKQTVERHQGRVWAEGAVGKGVTFYVTLNAEGIVTR
jgi:signal transduction histidine kinase